MYVLPTGPPAVTPELLPHLLWCLPLPSPEPLRGSESQSTLLPLRSSQTSSVLRQLPLFSSFQNLLKSHTQDLALIYFAVVHLHLRLPCGQFCGLTDDLDSCHFNRAPMFHNCHFNSYMIFYCIDIPEYIKPVLSFGCVDYFGFINSSLCDSVSILNSCRIKFRSKSQILKLLVFVTTLLTNYFTS